MRSRFHRILSVVFIGATCFTLGCQQNRLSTAELRALEAKPLYHFTETEIDAYLPHIRAAQPELPDRVITLARQAIGQPYELYLLGEYPFESHDPDPIYCLQRSDCLTFTEHIYSLAMSGDWWTYLRTLQRLRYRDGVVGMVTRNHYTIADWNRNNAFVLEDITPALGDGKAAAPLHQTCRRSRFFKKFGLGHDIPDEKIVDTYVPKAHLEGVLPELRNGDFVNIIRGSDKSQYCGHVGFIAIGDDGTVNFLDSAQPVVREHPLLKYVMGSKRCLGVKILRLRPDAEAIMADALASGNATEITPATMNRAADAYRASFSDVIPPVPGDWLDATHVQAYRIGYDTPVDETLQSELETLDARLCAEFGIPAEKRAVGVLDLNGPRLAMIRPDEMFYAASVPKICILAAYLENNPDEIGSMSPETKRELGRMIKHSDNQLAAKYGEIVGLDKLEKFVRSRWHRFYNEEHGGGLWIGKHYAKGSPRIGDPLHDHSHGATVRQVLRFYLMLEQDRLISAPACRLMREIFASPELDHGPTKFAGALADRDLSLIRKSGTWRDWHLDTARIAHNGRVYLLVGMTHHPKGAEYLAALARGADDLLAGAD